MCLAQGPQCSDAGEARTRGPLVSSQALNHWATALPMKKASEYDLEISQLPALLRCVLEHDTLFLACSTQEDPSLHYWKFVNGRKESNHV